MIEELKQLRDMMLMVGAKMLESDNSEIVKKGKELYGAAGIIENWIEGIEKDTQTHEDGL